ncbi:hypothetical protein M758_UG070200 [Ceratodon purpureus]|nr:hypothetical protein M758_UG070200 [Ceratodon purpureus]
MNFAFFMMFLLMRLSSRIPPLEDFMFKRGNELMHICLISLVVIHFSFYFEVVESRLFNTKRAPSLSLPPLCYWSPFVLRRKLVIVMQSS